MQTSNTRICLSVLFYSIITTLGTLLLLDKLGAQIIQYQMGHSWLYTFVLAQKSVNSGLPGWDGLLPLTTFLICFSGGLLCAWLSGVWLNYATAFYRHISHTRLGLRTQ